MYQDDFKRKTVVFSTDGAGTIGYPHAKNEVDPFLISYTIITKNPS